jgi:hypothetical protein
MKYFIPSLLLSMLFIFSSCVKKKCRIDGAYNFEIPVTLSPAKDTFNIGDTITIISTFPDEVYERKTDRTYKLIDFKFFPETSINKIDTVGQIDDFSEFDAIVTPTYNYSFFNYSDGGTTLVGEYNYSNNQYNLEYKIIPKIKGLYFLRHASSIVVLGDMQDFDGKCSRIDVHVKMTMNNNNNNNSNNIHMLNDSPDSHFNDCILQKPQQRFHDGGGYCFYVKE